MDVGVLLVFQNWFENMSDEEVFTRDLELGVLAEKYGFDSVWSAEHHFDATRCAPTTSRSCPTSQRAPRGSSWAPER